MAALQRSAVSFGRQGSSGLVWGDKFLSGESNQVANNQKQEQVTELQEKLYIKQEKDVKPISSLTRPISTIVRLRSNGGQRGYRTRNVYPAIEPSSPRVIACGFCSGFGEEKPTKNHYRKKAGKGEIEQALDKTVPEGSQSAEFLFHKGLFDPIVPETVIERPCELTVGLERTFNKAWSLLMEKGVRIVGISGLEGVGKTTLLTQIKNKFLISPNDYYLVIWVAVARRLGLQKIQEEIGNAIGFSGEQWQNKSLDAKAEDIFCVLSKRKFVLLFDDLWQAVDLDKVGVPFQLMPNGSKIAFTTTSESLCRHICADKIVALQILSQKYAFELFRKKTGEEMIDSNPTIFRLAHLVVGKCSCLPLALISAAHSMSFKRNPQEWYHALEILVLDKVKSIELFARSVPGSWVNVLSILKFGYDNLTCIAQSCLLYCSLFPEKFKILKDDLIDYWIFEELLHEHDSRASTQKLGLDIIDELVNANFLEEENQHVKMHSLVRRVALQIANMSKEKFFVQAGGHLTEVPRLAILKSNRRISLMENSIRNLSEVLECPELLTLFLGHNPLTRISDDFFLFMNTLKVLDLSNSSIEELPSGIPKLVSLQYLNLSYTCIEKLPYELKMLSNLKYLNLEYNDLLRVIPRQVISSLSSLRVLRMFRCGFSLIEEEDNILSDSNMHVNELQHLKHLNVLSITVKLASALEGLRSTHRLTSCTKALSLECLWGTKSLDISLLAAMEHLDTLEIHRTDHLEELNFDFMMEGADIQDLGSLCDSWILRKRSFNSLQEVSVGKCLHLRDLTWLILAPNLAVLRVTVCGDMEEIISIGQLGRILNGGENLIPFAKLKVLVLESLPKLKSIYRNTLPFPSLNKIRVLHCPLLKKLPLNSSSARGNAVAILAEDHWWEDVEWENEAAKTTFSQRFIHIPD